MAAEDASLVMEGVGGGGAPTSSTTVTLADPNNLVNYIKRVAFSFLDEDDSSPVNGTLNTLLNDSHELIRKFISDPMAKSIFVQKISNKGKNKIKIHL
jgi:hypothetical protein